MIKNVFKDKLNQMWSQLREWWLQTRRPPVLVVSKYDKFIGLLQNEKDGGTREHAETDYNRPMVEHEANQQRAAPNP